MSTARDFSKVHERLRLLVAFATDDLTTYTRVKWRQLWSDLQACIREGRAVEGWIEEVSDGRFVLQVDENTSSDNEKVKALQHTQRRLFGLLQHLLHEQTPPAPSWAIGPKRKKISYRNMTPVYGKKLTLTLGYTPVVKPNTPNSLGIYVSGRLEDLVIYQATRDLAACRRTLIRVCPQCKRPFYRNRKQKYCSRECGRLYYDPLYDGQKRGAS